MLQHHAIYCSCRLCKHRELSGRVVPDKILIISLKPQQTGRNLLPYLGRGAERRVVVVVEPLVTQNIPGAQPLFGVFHQQTFDEILGLRRDVSPLLGVKLELSLLNVGEEVHLAVVTLTPGRPGAVPATRPTEGRVAGQQDVHHHPEAPEVAPLVVLEVLLRVLDEGLHNLRGHELSAAHRGEEQGRGVGAAAGVELDSRPEVEVAELDRGEPVPVHAQHVLGFEVSVCNPFGVKKLQSGSNVTDDVSCLLLSEELPDNTKT